MKKKIPIGLYNYRKLKEENYYVVDKSLIIKDFLDSGAEVTLITRPRRFGKSLNMSMMSEFFDISKDSTDIFKDADIMQTEYSNKINQYPTIFLSFADAKGNRVNIVKCIKDQLLTVYELNSHILGDPNIFDKPKYEV